MRLSNLKKSITQMGVTEATDLIMKLRLFRRTYYQTSAVEARRKTNIAGVSKKQLAERKKAEKAELNAAQARELLTRLGIV